MMKNLLWEAPLVALAAMITGQFSVITVLSLYAVLWAPVRIALSVRIRKKHHSIPVDLLRFAINFVWDLTVSNLILAWDVLTPKDYHHVKMVNVPIEDLSDAEVALLAHRITLTPGTLACAVTEDRKSLIVHTMYFAHEGKGRELRRPIDILKGIA